MRRNGSLPKLIVDRWIVLGLAVALLLGAVVTIPVTPGLGAAGSAQSAKKKCKKIKNKQRRKRCRKKQAQQQAQEQAAAPATISISPASHDYGNVPINISSPSFDFVVTNTGPGKIGFTKESIGGADASAFNVSNSTCLSPLSPGASCSYSVNVRSPTTGAKSGLLNVVASPGDPEGAQGSASAALSANLF